MLVFLLFSLIIIVHCDNSADIRTKAQTLLDELFSTRETSELLSKFYYNARFNINGEQLDKNAFIEKYLLASKTKPILGNVALEKREEFKDGMINKLSGLPNGEMVTNEYFIMIWSWAEFGGDMTIDAREFADTNGLMITSVTMQTGSG